MIVEINQSGTAMMFKHMNKAVVDQHQQSPLPIDLHLHKDMFEQIHSVRVIIENCRWHAVEFPSEQAYLIAMLKWQ